MLQTDNILFHKQKYHAASTHQTYLAQLPRGYEGQFGPGIKALTLAFYYGMGTSELKIKEFFENVGIQISDGEISNLLIKDQESYQVESDAVYDAGLRSSPWQQTDDTLTRVYGQNQHCHVVCNPVYTAYPIRPNKDRLSILDVLRNGRKRTFRRYMPWAKKVWRAFKIGVLKVMSKIWKRMFSWNVWKHSCLN